MACILRTSEQADVLVLYSCLTECRSSTTSKKFVPIQLLSGAKDSMTLFCMMIDRDLNPIGYRIFKG